MSFGLLRVVVNRATNLKDADAFSKSDPIVLLQCNGQKQQTTVVKNSLNPIWNEEFKFEVPVSHSRGGYAKCKQLLFVDVLDYDGPGKPGTPLGSGTIDLRELNCAQPAEKILELDHKGRIFLNVEATNFGIPVAPPTATTTEGAHTTVPDGHPGSVFHRPPAAHYSPTSSPPPQRPYENSPPADAYWGNQTSIYSQPGAGTTTSYVPANTTGGSYQPPARASPPTATMAPVSSSTYDPYPPLVDEHHRAHAALLSRSELLAQKQGEKQALAMERAHIESRLREIREKEAAIDTFMSTYNHSPSQLQLSQRHPTYSHAYGSGYSNGPMRSHSPPVSPHSIPLPPSPYVNERNLTQLQEENRRLERRNIEERRKLAEMSRLLEQRERQLDMLDKELTAPNHGDHWERPLRYADDRYTHSYSQPIRAPPNPSSRTPPPYRIDARASPYYEHGYDSTRPEYDDYRYSTGPTLGYDGDGVYEEFTAYRKREL
eukprot:NODE_1504_length_1706_cov_50.941883_g1426_i0.p1 GENE.NODE_1504_length_1706_cov_50.941883_g1426_i0~~NODE_1504_length_1706_cov_50.941883_g1426_i0.p1  ORF type:complete len:488 (+),score=76.88 NODE_1504_length_1706_cov_50.941883_g1426_i0:106-1569(+)